MIQYLPASAMGMGQVRQKNGGQVLQKKQRGRVFILDNLVSRPATPPLRHKDGG